MSAVMEDADHLALVKAAEKDLAIRFPNCPAEDHEDFALLGYERFLCKSREGQEIASPAAFVKKAAGRELLDHLRADRSDVHKAAPIDPQSPALLAIADSGPDIESELLLGAERARIRASVEGMLTDREREVYRVRFEDDLKAGEASKALGVSRSNYFRLLQSAVEKVQSAIEIPASFTEVQQKLIAAFLAGKPGRQYDAAKDLIETDPQSRALALELAHAHRGISGLLPPAAFTFEDPSTFDRASDLMVRAKERIIGSATDATDTATTIAASGGTRGAGTAASGGILASLAGAGTKVAALCAGTAAAGACVSAVGILPGPIDPFDFNQPPKEREAQETKKKRSLTSLVEGAVTPIENIDTYEPSPTPNNGGGGGDNGGNDGGSNSSPEPAPAPAPAPSPAPAPAPAPSPAEQQFDPLAPSPSQSAAPPPSSSSGSSSTSGGGGGSTGAAKQELGRP